MLATARIATTPSPGLTEELVDDELSFRELEPEWNELLQNSESSCLFLTSEWLLAWWKHLADDRRLAILALRRGGELAALAPCCVRPADWRRGRLLPVMEFLGSGYAGSDYLDFIIRAGLEEPLRGAIGSRLAHQRVTHKWTQMRHGAYAASVASGLSQTGWTVDETIINQCPYIPLKGVSWDAYLASLGSEHRYNFHRKWKRLNRDFAASFDLIRSADECRESIERLFAQNNARWNERGGSEAFHQPELRAFHREFSQIALQRGWLRLYVLRLNERPAALLYGFLYGRKFYFYQSSFDSAYGKHSPGLITMGLAIRNAIEEGAEEYDMLHGDETYKSHWCRNQRDLSRLELYPPDSSAQMFRSAIGLVRGSRRFVRRVTLGRRPA
jgi:CelD/BcsL family acetyltransferase involved in cellulose biosynthesis